jgi:hypothetical protein
MGDNIKNLPVDATVSTVNEVNIVNTLFSSQKSNFKKLFSGTKDVLIAGVLFSLLNLPFVNNFIRACFKCGESEVYLLVIKTALFMILFFIAQNYFLAKK